MKSFYCLVLFLATAVIAQADPPEPEDVLRPWPDEGNWYVQLDLGLNITQRTGGELLDSLIDTDNTPMGLAPLVGVSAGYRFSDAFGLRFRWDFDPRNLSNSGSFMLPCNQFDPSGNPTGTEPSTFSTEYDLDVTYISFSLLADIFVEDFYFFFGPSVGVPISSSYRADYEIDPEANCNFLAGSQPSKTFFIEATEEITAATRVSMKLGAGYSTEINDNTELVFSLGYDFGITELSDKTFSMVVGNGTTGELFDIGSGSTDIVVGSLQTTVGIRVNL